MREIDIKFVLDDYYIGDLMIIFDYIVVKSVFGVMFCYDERKWIYWKW